MAKKGLQKKTRIANKILTVVFSLVSLLYLYPLVMMVLILISVGLLRRVDPDGEGGGLW